MTITTIAHIMNAKLKTAAYITLTLLALVLATPFSGAQTLTAPISYNKLLSDSTRHQHATKTLDEVTQAINVLANGNQTIYAETIAAHLKQNYPEIDPNAMIRLLPEMRETVITKGAEYEHLVNLTTSLLKSRGLNGKVVPVLYRSQQPVVALSYPNALIFSTRALDLLNNNEIEALAAHELGHLIANGLYRRAVEKSDNETLRVLELFYDATAACILQNNGKNPRALITGLYKLQQVLELEYNTHNRKGQVHPTMSQRERLNKELIRQFALNPTS